MTSFFGKKKLTPNNSKLKQATEKKYTYLYFIVFFLSQLLSLSKVYCMGIFVTFFSTHISGTGQPQLLVCY